MSQDGSANFEATAQRAENSDRLLVTHPIEPLFFEELFEQWPDAALLINPDSAVIQANQQALDLLGYGRQDLLGRDVTTVVVSKVGTPLTANAVAPDWIGLHADGTCTPVEATTRSLSQGHWAAFLRPPARGSEPTQVTQPTQTPEALYESELRFRTLADNIAQLAWIADKTGWICWYNQRWFDYTGMTFEEAQGWGWQKVHHPDYVERVVYRVQHCFAIGEIWEDTFPLRGRDGSYRWFLSRAIPIRDQQGQVLRWFGTNTDITERKQAEAALEEQNHHIQILYETTRDLLSTDQPLTLVETVFARLKPRMELDVYFNYWLDEAQQQLHLLFHGGISDEIAQSIEWLDVGCAVCGTVAQQRRQIVQFDLQHSIDPKTKLVRDLGLTAYSCQPLVAQGKLFGTLGFGSRSRTRFTVAEISLFQAICDQIAIALERSELVVSLQQQTAELIQAHQLKDEFLAALSHELRTPLNPILGWTKLMQNQKLTATQTTKALSTIERNVKQQIALVNDLLDMSSVIQGNFNLNCSPVDLGLSLNQALAAVQFAAQAKGITINVVQPEPQQSPSPLRVMGDSDRLRQIFWNLLSNAVKFTPEGGQVTVEIATVTAEKPNPAVQIRVIDNGVGIAALFLPYVFDHFRQADGSSTRKYGGLGLGLSIVKHLIELQGGTVGVDSAGLGQGATFTVQLPLYLEGTPFLVEPIEIKQEDELPSPKSSSPPALTGTQILLVDDDSDNLDLLRFLLQQNGAVVTALTSPVEALQVMTDCCPDLIISDIGMPEMNGYEFIQQVRALPQGRQIPALAFTAFTQPATQEEVLSAGFQAYLPKPVDPLQFLAAVQQFSATQPMLNPASAAPFNQDP